MDGYDESLETSEEVSSEPEPEAPEEEPSELEPEAPEEVPSEPEPEEPAPEPEAPEEIPSEPEPETPEEITGEPEPEAPPTEETVGGDETVKDLIDAIGDLSDTITGAVTQEPEELPAGGEGGGDPGGELQVVEPVDLSPVVKVLERNEKLLIHTNELLEQQGEVLVTQHNDFLQLQANVDFIFLAVAALIGVVLGVAVGKVFHDLWRA